MRAIRRGVPRFQRAEFRRIVAIVGDVHPFGSVPDQRAQRIVRIVAGRRRPQRLVRRDQLQRALPDQFAHTPGAGFRFENVAQPTQVRHAFERFERRAGQVEQREEHDEQTGNAQRAEHHLARASRQREQHDEREQSTRQP